MKPMKMKCVIIDNYDSFTYNLSHLIKEVGGEVTIFHNDEFQLCELECFDKIVLSPGPGLPSQAGELLDVMVTSQSLVFVWDIKLSRRFSERSWNTYPMCFMGYPPR